MKNKVVIITGASSGIGEALADKFGTEGAKVVITGRRQEELERVATQLQAKQIDVLPIKADVTSEVDNKAVVAQTLQKFGKIDVLINNAGISMRALFKEVDLSVVRKVLEINFFGVLSMTQFCLPHIIKQKGSVIGISSIAGYRGLPGRTGYSSSKFALQGFLEVLRTEMMAEGVHVLTACPGFTTSNIRKVSLTKDGSQQGESPRNEQKMMSAEECAQHIYKATVARQRDLVLTRQGKLTVWLNKLLPGLADKLVYNVMAKEPGSGLKPL
jgi:short-subunit dehydrogenase